MFYCVRGYMFRSLVTIIRPFCESIVNFCELIHKRAWWWSLRTETCSLAHNKTRCVRCKLFVILISKCRDWRCADVLPGQRYGVTVEWWLAGRNWDTKSEGTLIIVCMFLGWYFKIITYRHMFSTATLTAIRQIAQSGYRHVAPRDIVQYGHNFCFSL